MSLQNRGVSVENFPQISGQLTHAPLSRRVLGC